MNLLPRCHLSKTQWSQHMLTTPSVESAILAAPAAPVKNGQATTSVNINDSEKNHLPAAKTKINARIFMKSLFILNLVDIVFLLVGRSKLRRSISCFQVFNGLSPDMKITIERQLQLFVHRWRWNTVTWMSEKNRLADVCCSCTVWSIF